MTYRNHRKHRHNEEDSGMGCLVMIVLALLAMPIVGLVMLLGKDNEQKGIGLVLLIVGVILWVVVVLQG